MTVNNAIPFMAKNKVEKRKFIEDIFGMEVFSQMLSTLRAEYNDVKKEYEIDQSKLDELQKTYAEYIKQQDDILVTRKSKKSIYKSRQQNNIDELTKLNKELSQYKEEDLDKIEKSIEQLNNHLPKCDAKITEYVENISSEKAKIGHLKDVLSKIGTDEDTCPVCLKSIQDHDKGYINKEKEQLKNTIKLMVDGIKNVNESLKKCKGVKETICKAITDNNQRLSDAMLSKQRVGNINDKIQQIHKWQDELQVDLDVIESTNTDFDNLIESSYSRINELLDKVNKLKKHIANLDIVKYVVSEEGVKSYIVNRLLELLNSK